MNIFFTYLILITLIIFNGCEMREQKVEFESYKNEIIGIEKEFETMVFERGMPEAFLHFAAEDAVLYRNNTLIKGKNEIKEYFRDQVLTEIKLQWTPDFVDVSDSGDLAYTYG